MKKNNWTSNTRKKKMLVIRACMVICIVFFAAQMKSGCVYAAEAEEVTEGVQENGTEINTATQLQQIMVTARKVEMKAEPDFTSETLMTYEKGASVFVIDAIDDDWVYARYQDMTGYVDKTALLMQTMDTTDMDAEFARETEQTKFVLEEVERYKAEARRSKIWGTVIVVLVLGIFAMGIISGIRAKKKEEAQEDESKVSAANELLEPKDTSQKADARKKDTDVLDIEDLDL